MESVLKSLFKRELKAILASYSDIICALFIIAIIGYIIYYLYNKFNENKTKNNVNSIVNPSPSEKTFLDTLLQILKYTIIYALVGFAILFILLILIGVMAE